jgi:hypothetical protein
LVKERKGKDEWSVLGQCCSRKDLVKAIKSQDHVADGQTKKSDTINAN